MIIGPVLDGFRHGKLALIAATCVIQLVFLFAIAQCWAVQADNGSEDVSRRLDAATQHLTPLDQYSPDEDAHWIVTRLVDLRLQNGQRKEAVEVAEQTTGELRADLFSQVFLHGIETATEVLKQEDVSEAQRNLSQNELRYAFGHATQWEILSSYRLFREFGDLLECGELEFVKQVIAPLPEINPDYEFRNGSYGGNYYQMRLLAKLAAHHMRSGNDGAAHEIIARYQVEVTRDQARLFIVEECLSEDRLNLPLANRMLEQFEGAGKRFSAAFRIGMYCVQNGMPDEALELVEILDENYDETDPRNRVYEARLLICLAQLQNTRGAPYDSLLHKAVAISGNNREDRRHIACVRALAGDLDAANKSVITAFLAIDRLLDIDNRRSTSYLPFYHVKPEDRIAAATELAKHFDNVHVSAVALCKVANALSETETAKAKALVDLAWDAALSSDRMESIPGFSPELIQPSWAFKNIVESYARCGWPLQAMNAADRVSEEIDEALTTRDGRTASHRQGAVKGICQLVADTDRAFVEDQGREVFELLRRLQPYDEWLSPHDTACLVGRFAQLEQWDQAVRALAFCQSELAETADGISSSMIRPLLEHNQQHRLREMLDVCNDQGRQRLINQYCSYSNGHQWRPQRETVELVRSMTDLDTANRTIRQFLLGGYWAIGEEVIAHELIDHLTENEDSDTPRQNYFALELAMNQRLPALALELIAVREDDDSRFRFLLHTSGLMASDQEQLQQLETWATDRPSLDQAMIQIGVAQSLLNKD